MMNYTKLNIVRNIIKVAKEVLRLVLLILKILKLLDDLFK